MAKHPGGRPTGFKPEYVDQAFKLCLLGADDNELADFFDVSQKTINNWKHQHPEFFQSLKDAKTKADSEVAAKLRDRALGYEWDEFQIVKLKTVLYENGKRVSEVERAEAVPVHKVIPPDPTSAIFWLKNRKSKYWRDKQEIDHTSGGDKIGMINTVLTQIENGSETSQ